jgi:phosphoribosyl 1,2-cyclic phosphate phosphodiesterase
MSDIEIRFLGTSAARPIPRWGCKCPQCSVAGTSPHARRTRSAILVNKSLLVDSGPDIYDQLHTIPYDDLALIDNIVITHAHADHVLGLDDLASLRRISQLPVLPLHSLPDSWERIHEGFRYLIASESSQYDIRPFAHRELELGKPLVLTEGLKVTPLDTHHTQPFTTAGLLIEQDDRRVFYAPDLGDLSIDQIAGVDLLILDGSFLSKEQMGKRYTPLLEEGQGRHMPILESAQQAQETGVQRIIFTHIGHLRQTADQLLDQLPAGCEVAYDGLVITV